MKDMYGTTLRDGQRVLYLSTRSRKVHADNRTVVCVGTDGYVLTYSHKRGIYSFCKAKNLYQLES